MMDLPRQNEWSAGVGLTLLHFLWQGIVVAGLLWIALHLKARKTPEFRYALSCGGMLILLACPVVTFFLIPSASFTSVNAGDKIADGAIPLARGDALEGTSDGSAGRARRSQWVANAPRRLHLSNSAVGKNASVTSTTSADVQTLDFAQMDTPEANELGDADESDQATFTARTYDFITPYLPYLTGIWCAGVGMLCLWHVGGLWTIHRWRHGGAPLDSLEWTGPLAKLSERMEVHASVALMQSARVVSPIVVGIVKPAILIPASLATGLSTEQIEAILAHELAHIRRHDYLVNLLQAVAETVLFYHPCVWWVSRQVRRERELCCDVRAVTALGNRHNYAESLVSISDRIFDAPRAKRLRVALSPVDRLAPRATHSLLHRLRHLLGAPTTPSSRLWTILVSLILLATFSTGIYLGCHAQADDELRSKWPRFDDISERTVTRDGKETVYQVMARFSGIRDDGQPMFFRCSDYENGQPAGHKSVRDGGKQVPSNTKGTGGRRDIVLRVRHTSSDMWLDLGLVPTDAPKNISWVLQDHSMVRPEDSDRRPVLWTASKSASIKPGQSVPVFALLYGCQLTSVSDGALLEGVSLDKAVALSRKAVVYSMQDRRDGLAPTPVLKARAEIYLTAGDASDRHAAAKRLWRQTEPLSAEQLDALFSAIEKEAAPRIRPYLFWPLGKDISVKLVPVVFDRLLTYADSDQIHLWTPAVQELRQGRWYEQLKQRLPTLSNRVKLRLDFMNGRLGPMSGEQYDPKAVDFLLSIIRDSAAITYDGSTDAFRKACRTLGLVGDPRAVPELVRALVRIREAGKFESSHHIQTDPLCAINILTGRNFGNIGTRPNWLTTPEKKSIQWDPIVAELERDYLPERKTTARLSIVTRDFGSIYQPHSVERRRPEIKKRAEALGLTFVFLKKVCSDSEYTALRLASNKPIMKKQIDAIRKWEFEGMNGYRAKYFRSGLGDRIIASPNPAKHVRVVTPTFEEQCKTLPAWKQPMISDVIRYAQLTPTQAAMCRATQLRAEQNFRKGGDSWTTKSLQNRVRSEGWNSTGELPKEKRHLATFIHRKAVDAKLARGDSSPAELRRLLMYQLEDGPRGIITIDLPGVDVETIEKQVAPMIEQELAGFVGVSQRYSVAKPGKYHLIVVETPRSYRRWLYSRWSTSREVWKRIVELKDKLPAGADAGEYYRGRDVDIRSLLDDLQMTTADGKSPRRKTEIPAGPRVRIAVDFKKLSGSRVSCSKIITHMPGVQFEDIIRDPVKASWVYTFIGQCKTPADAKDLFNITLTRDDGKRIPLTNVAKITVAKGANPSLAGPVVVCTMKYPGADAKTVEREVAAVVENAVEGIKGIKKLKSRSTAGAYRLEVIFEPGTRADIADILVKSRIHQAAAKLPQAVRAQGIQVKPQQPDEASRATDSTVEKRSDVEVVLVTEKMMYFAVGLDSVMKALPKPIAAKAGSVIRPTTTGGSQTCIQLPNLRAEEIQQLQSVAVDAGKGRKVRLIDLARIAVVNKLDISDVKAKMPATRSAEKQGDDAITIVDVDSLPPRVVKGANDWPFGPRLRFPLVQKNAEQIRYVRLKALDDPREKDGGTANRRIFQTFEIDNGRKKETRQLVYELQPMSAVVIPTIGGSNPSNPTPHLPERPIAKGVSFGGFVLGLTAKGNPRLLAVRKPDKNPETSDNTRWGQMQLSRSLYPQAGIAAGYAVLQWNDLFDPDPTLRGIPEGMNGVMQSVTGLKLSQPASNDTKALVRQWRARLLKHDRLKFAQTHYGHGGWSAPQGGLRGRVWINPGNQSSKTAEVVNVSARPVQFVWDTSRVRTQAIDTQGHVVDPGLSWISGPMAYKKEVTLQPGQVIELRLTPPYEFKKLASDSPAYFVKVEIALSQESKRGLQRLSFPLVKLPTANDSKFPHGKKLVGIQPRFVKSWWFQSEETPQEALKAFRAGGVRFDGRPTEMIGKAGKKHAVKSVGEFLDLWDKGYRPGSQQELRTCIHFSVAQAQLKRLGKAKPSRVSFVRDMTWDKTLAEKLPAGIWRRTAYYEFPKEELVKKLQGKKLLFDRAKPLKIATYPKPQLGLAIDFREQGEHVVDEKSVYSLYTKPLGWGDFNGDGIEDILCELQESAWAGTGGRSYPAGTVLLTRLKKNGPLVMVANASRSTVAGQADEASDH